MATYWVRAGGNDSNDGLSYANARLTLASIIDKMRADAAAAGSILNVVNDQTYVWPTTEVNLSSGNGSSFSSFGYLIRGVSDSAETPAFATVASSGGSAIRRLLNMQSGSGWIIVRNLIFDATANETDASVYTVARYQSPSGPIWFDGCALKTLSLGSSNTPGARQLLNVTSSAPNGTLFTDCYLQNLRTTVHNIGATLSKSVIGCLFYNDIAASTISLISQTLGASATGGGLTFTYNTLYRSIGNNGFVYPLIYSINAGATDAGLVDLHSNLIFSESTHVSPGVGLISDAGGGPLTVGTRGYNVLQGGPNVTIGDVAAGGYYTGSFDAGSDPKATDQVAYSVAEATLFNAPGSTYAWDPLGNGATITIPKDLRPRLYLTASQAGDVPGALPAAETDYAVTLGADNTAPEPDDTVALTATVTNTGTSATGVQVTAAVPAGLTFVSATPSVGSYDSGTGIWAVGSMANGASATLTLTVTVDSDQAGNDIVVTASQTAGDPSSDPDSSNNSDSLTLSVVLDIDVDPGEIPYLDVAPIYAPVLLAEINADTKLVRNRITHWEQRRDFERRRFREYTGRRITIPASTTITVTSSIERIDHLLIEATGDVAVSISSGTSDNFMPAATHFALFNGDFTTLKISNPSSTDSVDVLLVVID